MFAMEEQQFIRFSIVERFYVPGNNKTCLRLHVKYPIFCPILNKIGFYVQICIEVPNMKFAEMQPVGA
jgi:hypothetical protein